MNIRTIGFGRELGPPTRAECYLIGDDTSSDVVDLKCEAKKLLKQLLRVLASRIFRIYGDVT